MLRLLRYVFILIVLLVAVAVGAFYLTPGSVIAGQIEAQIEAATGREATVSDSLERRLYPSLGVTLRNLEIANPDWAEAAALVEAAEVRADVDVLGLLTGAVRITEIALISPRVHLEALEDGRRTWEFDASAGGDAASGDQPADSAGADEADDGGGVMDVSIADARIVDGAVTFIDRASGQTLQVEDLQLTGGLPSVDAALTLDATAMVNGEATTLAAAIDSPGALQRGEDLTIVAELSAPGLDGRLTAQGAPTGGDLPTVDGDAEFALSGDQALTDWLRRALPPEFEDVGAVAVRATFDVADAALSLAVDGDAEIRGQAADLRLSVLGGPGWSGGAEPLEIDFAADSALLDAGYVGSVAAGDGGGALQGDWSLRASDAQALLALVGATPEAGDPVRRLDAVDLSGTLAFDASGARAEFAGDVGFGDRPVSISGDVLGGADWNAGGDTQLSLSVSSPDLFTLGWSGRARTDADGAPEAVDGRLTFASQALREFALWAGEAPLDAPPGTFETASFEADLALGADSASIDGMTAAVDDTTVSGDIAVSGPPILGAPRGDGRPRVTAALEAGALDIRPSTGGGPSAPSGAGAATGGGGAGGGATGGSGGGWGDAPFELGALRLVDADLDIRFEGLATSVIRLGRSRVTATLDQGDLDISVVEMGLYGGGAAGTLGLDATSDTLGLDSNLRVQGVSLLPLLQDVGGLDWLDGTGAATIAVNGSGAHLQALMDSLGGSASIQLTDGAVIGYNLAAMVRNLTGQGGGDAQRTDFASITASFALSQGVARNDDLQFLGPLVRMTGAGTIDIGGQTIDYLARPSAVATLEGQGGDAGLRGLTFPIRIRGPWSGPSVGPDLNAGIDDLATFAADPAALQDALGDALGGDALGDALGGVLGGDGEGGGIEDAIGGALGDALGGGGEDGGGGIEDAIGGALGGALGGGGDDADDDGGRGLGGAVRGLFGN